MANKHLTRAKRQKNDEFYTQLPDIENELRYYKEYFRGQTVYCNCDDPRASKFFHYFSYNFEHLGLKRLIATCYRSQSADSPSRNDSTIGLLLEYTGDKNGNRVPDEEEIGKGPLDSDGDFRSRECIELLEQADIVVTNPPFSLFREYVAQLVEHGKKFLIIGNKNAITYKEVFKLIKNGKVWLGHTSPGEFLRPDGTLSNVAGLTRWFTNLPTRRRTEELILYKQYHGHKDEYPHYDNYDAIEVGRVKNIPKGYEGVMGVPITFLDKHNPEQFEIVGQMVTTKIDEFNHGYPYVGGKKKYARILIRKVEK